MSHAILIVGSFNQDLTWNCAEFPEPGETIFGVFSTGPGGKGSNQAVAAARTGVPTTFVGGIGRDLFGEGVKHFWETEHIDARVIEYSSVPTGNAGIFVSGRAENEIIVALGANLAFSLDDFAEDIFAGAQIVVCQNEIRLETTLAVLEGARRRGISTVLNPAPMIPDCRADYLTDVDILIPNETEFSELVSNLDPDTHSSFTPGDIEDLPDSAMHDLCRRIGVPTVILTLGRRGCLLSQNDGFTALPAHTGIEVTDTTGAGDAFVGGFASGMVQFGQDLQRAAAYGNAVAALSVTKPGTAPSMPHREEIDRFLDSS